MEPKVKLAVEVSIDIAKMFKTLLEKSELSKTDLMKKLIVDKFNDLKEEK